MASDKELELDEGFELSLDDGVATELAPDDSGLELDGVGLELDDLGGELVLGDDLPSDLSEDDGGFELGVAGLDLGDSGLDLGGDDAPPQVDATMTGLKLGDDLDLGADVLNKLKEIDAIMEQDATQSRPLPQLAEDDLDEGLSFAMPGEEESSEDIDASDVDAGFNVEGLDLADGQDGPFMSETSDAQPRNDDVSDSDLSFDAGSLDFGGAAADEPAPVIATKLAPAVAPVSATHGRVEVAPAPATAASSGHYHAELERLQATINHLREDRQALQARADAAEEDKLAHNRQLLTLRSELDERKIEVQLLRKRSHDSHQDLELRLKLEEERRLLAEERVKTLQQELTTLQQKMKTEVRRVGGRERELEQQLELLRTDTSTQIRHRDQKILELKRRLDAMEFEVENVAGLEKKAVGDRQELEGKLDKAIKTLRSAIGILELDDPKLATLERLKKNLDV